MGAWCNNAYAREESPGTKEHETRETRETVETIETIGTTNRRTQGLGCDRRLPEHPGINGATMGQGWHAGKA